MSSMRNTGVGFQTTRRSDALGAFAPHLMYCVLAIYFLFTGSHRQDAEGANVAQAFARRRFDITFA
jgi:hypothetical protein